MNLFNKLWRGRRRSRPGDERMKPRRFTPSVEPLEAREVPVVGAFDIPSQIFPDTPEGMALDGVVTVGGTCSGSLLYTGRHVLTAAHCVDGPDADAREDTENIVVVFTLAGGRTIAMTSTQVSVHPNWNGDLDDGWDFAILTLPALAPVRADRYDIYRNSDERGQVFQVAGYGAKGTGTAGHDGTFGVLRTGWNRFDRVVEDVAILRFDFDNGTSGKNKLGDRGLGASESNTAPGDSGGPSFIDGKIAAVTMGGDDFFSRFGDVSFSGRVSAAAPWIDTSVGGRYHLIVDMGFQPGRNDGRQDVVQLRRSGDNLQVLLDGVLLHQDELTDIGRITIRGSNDPDSIIVSDVLGVSITVDGGGGNDFLVGPYYVFGSTWYVTTTDGGVLTPGGRSDSPVIFSAVENLVGAAATDHFILSDLRGISGSIDGGAGSDTLDFSAFTWFPLTVNLQTGQASFVGYLEWNRVLRIENVTGGAGSDVLTGTLGANILRGNGGIDYLYGLEGDDWLYGGAGNDWLYGEYATTDYRFVDGGSDHLYGEADNDYLDGGYDTARDYLDGGSGRDTFVDILYWRSTWDPLLGRFVSRWVSFDTITVLPEDFVWTSYSGY